MADTIPIILLKNPSSGYTDPYTTHFASDSSLSSSYEPIYITVLEHASHVVPILDILSHYSQSKHQSHGSTEHFPYGGLIFTSQRAVEAFASALDSCCPVDLRHLAIPLYAVGPATARSLHDIREKHMPHCWTHGGEDAGTGELLAELILKDYNALCKPFTGFQRRSEPDEKKPLLFLTGAKHRDIVPDTLQCAPGDQRIAVETMVVYATSESPSFPSDIAAVLKTTATAPVRWIVIFSPTGGESLLRALGWIPDDSQTVCNLEDLRLEGRRTFIASIGPTTRDYMKDTFDFHVDVCAEKPSPEGVRKGIEEFMRTSGLMP
ncbi:MAG: hypothetical protein Q9166_002948 [cf. Caloplaca sp. 2 TL-2023]